MPDVPVQVHSAKVFSLISGAFYIFTGAYWENARAIYNYACAKRLFARADSYLYMAFFHISGAVEYSACARSNFARAKRLFARADFYLYRAFSHFARAIEYFARAKSNFAKAKNASIGWEWASWLFLLGGYWWSVRLGCPNLNNKKPHLRLFVIFNFAIHAHVYAERILRRELQ